MTGSQSDQHTELFRIRPARPAGPGPGGMVHAYRNPVPFARSSLAGPYPASMAASMGDDANLTVAGDGRARQPVPQTWRGTPIPVRILIVDDDPTIRSVLEALLEDEGFTPVVAANGRDALAVTR